MKPFNCFFIIIKITKMIKMVYRIRIKMIRIFYEKKIKIIKMSMASDVNVK